VGRPDAYAGEVPVAYVTVRQGTTTSEDELHAWASEHVTERAAAPKAVSIVDTLPVTAIGKPYKLPLRADAARTAIRDALAGYTGIESVDATVEDGAAVVTVTLDSSTDRRAVEQALDRYPVKSRLEEKP
jgi:fatty-acyl-CoA synthase